MPKHILTFEWQKVAQTGDFAKVINTGKVPVQLDSGSTVPPGGVYSLVDLRKDLHAKCDEPGGEIQTEVRAMNVQRVGAAREQRA